MPALMATIFFKKGELPKRKVICFLINILRKQRKRRLHQNLHIQPHRPVVDICNIQLHPPGHLLDGLGFPPAAAHLRQAGNAGLDAVAGHVGGDLVGVVVVMGDGVRAGADQRHVAEQHIEELRQFVQRSAANELADLGDARVFTRGLLDHLVVVYAHGAELPDLDDLVVHAVAVLLEDDGPRRGELDGDGDGGEQRAQHQQGQGGDGAVHHRFKEGGSRVGGERAFVEVDGRHAVDLAHRMVEQHQAVEIRHPNDVDVGVQQVDVEAFDVLGLGQRQGDIEAADVHQLDQLAQLGEVAHHGVEAVVLVVRLRAHQAEHRLVVFAHQLVRQVHREFAGADDERGALALAALMVGAGERLQRQVQRHLAEEAGDGPGEHHFARVQFAGLGEVGDHGEPGQQHQPGAEQAGDAGAVAMGLVEHAEQGIGRYRGEHADDEQGAVVGGEVAGLVHHQADEQRSEEGFRRQPLAPEGQAAVAAGAVQAVVARGGQGPRGPAAGGLVHLAVEAAHGQGSFCRFTVRSGLLADFSAGLEVRREGGAEQVRPARLLRHGIQPAGVGVAVFHGADGGLQGEQALRHRQAGPGRQADLGHRLGHVDAPGAEVEGVFQGGEEFAVHFVLLQLDLGEVGPGGGPRRAYPGGLAQRFQRGGAGGLSEGVAIGLVGTTGGERATQLLEVLAVGDRVLAHGALGGGDGHLRGARRRGLFLLAPFGEEGPGLEAGEAGRGHLRAGDDQR